MAILEGILSRIKRGLAQREGIRKGGGLFLGRGEVRRTKGTGFRVFGLECLTGASSEAPPLFCVRGTAVRQVAAKSFQAKVSELMKNLVVSKAKNR